MKRTVGFSITGEFVTNHVRNLWAEYDYSGAVDFLDCIDGASHEQKLEVLFGTKKFVGTNNLDLVDDNWKPDEDIDYPSYTEGLSRGDNYHELLEYREKEAWDIAYNEWPWQCSRTGFGSKTSANPAISRIQKLVGKKRADQILAEVQDDMMERQSTMSMYKNSSTVAKSSGLDMLYAETQQKLLITAIQTGADISTVPTVDAMMNRGSNIPMVIDSKMESKSGWLLPDGKYYKCGTMEHIGLAESLMEKSVHFTSSENAEHIAESNGWIKISGGYAISEKKPTQKQLDKLWDYSVLHKKDYDLLCAPLRNN